MPDKSSIPARAKSVLEYLRRFKNDRGAMSQLRCALAPTRRHRAWPLLGPLNAIDDPVVEIIAGLFALHPEETGAHSFGETCRQLASQHNSFEARFQRLLACDRQEICQRLHPAIMAAKARRCPVNYESLCADLYWWGDATKARWAREFWQGQNLPAPAGEPGEENP